MNRLDIPFNIRILQLSDDLLRGLRPVRSLDILEGATNSYHPDGFYSTEIFGRVGDPLRMKSFSYIDIKVSVFHPIIFNRLRKMKALYQGIMSGKEYAKWDAEKRDFVAADQLEGKSGFDFFVRYWDQIVVEDTGSTERQETIALINAYRKEALTNKIVVMPAGYREVETDNGRMREPDIISFYKRLLSIANSIAEAAVKLNPEAVNTARYNLQTAFVELYNFIESLVEGKKKLMLGKWASRATFDGTRNVITAMLNTSKELLGDFEVDLNSTQVGLYQTVKGLRPVVVHAVLTGIIQKAFSTPDQPTMLVDPKTLKRVPVQLKTPIYDKWASVEGLEKQLNKLAIDATRHKPVMVGSHYLALIYQDDHFFKVFFDIGDLPEGLDPSKVRPLSYGELFYVSFYKESARYPLVVTRYPVTGVGSIYPSKVYLRTTVQAKSLLPLNDDWEPMDESYRAAQFPIPGEAFINSQIPHSTRLALLGADFDGDTMNGLFLYTEDSIEEIDKFIASKKSYIGTDGRPLASISVSTLDLVFHNMSSD